MLIKSVHRQKFIINNVPFFSTLSPESIIEVERIIFEKRFTKNQVVLFEEETSNYMYFVYSGKVRVVQLNEEGREQILTIHKKNDYFGEMALLDNKTAPATVIAIEDSVVGLLARDDFERLLANNEKIRQHIITMLCTRLREAWMMVRIMSFDNAEKRIIGVLDRLKDLYGVQDQRGVIINLKLTHNQIANYASVSRETVTRTLNRLMKNDDIEFLSNRQILMKTSFISKLKSQS